MRFAIGTAVLLGILLVDVSVSASASASSEIDTHLESVKEIYEWVNGGEDGFVTDKISVSRMVPNDLSTPLVVYATEDIEEDELLIRVPWTHILKSDDPDEDDELGWYCGTAIKLKEEMEKGRESFYAPYVTYLNDEPRNQLPAQYSRKAKNMLRILLGTHEDEYDRSPIFERDRANNIRLMPIQITRGLDRHWHNLCGAPVEDTEGARAASFVIQRADDFILIPAYDSFNHRNSDPHNGREYMNARAETALGESHQSFAIRDIQKGEQIFISYNLCEQCGGRKYYGFGTGEMFRDYGFVEWYPQRWYYPGFGDYNSQDNDLEANQFDLYQNEDTKDLTLVWSHLTKSEDKIDRFKVFLAREIRRLNRLNNIEWAAMHSWNATQWEESKITDYEWTNIQNLLKANVVAMSIALEDLSRDLPNSINPGNRKYDYDEIEEDDQDDDGKNTTNTRPPMTVPEERITQYTAGHYDPLDGPETDDMAYYKFTCDIDDYQNFTGYIDTEVKQSGRNQILGFWESYLFDQGPEDADVCFDVNNVIQTCSNNRPYHHEHMVHVAARYVENVKKVAIVGSGASMFLHEVMTKYSETIEYVLNLELDQTVTRKAFQHFKTDPYFDDPRVDWWFGNIEESLSVLPESFWGSFDLVLVDAQEYTLMKTVPNETDDLDVLSALKLLVNPDTGVFAKNDLFYSKTAQKFPYAVELTYQSPMVCDEILALGSEGVDFVRSKIYDHGIEAMGNLLYRASPASDSPRRHDLVHDYQSSTKAAERRLLCGKQETDEPQINENEPQQATNARGVLELLTFENPGFPVDSFKDVAQTLMETFVKDTGFTIVENGIVYKEDPHELVLIVMEEGYLAARLQKDDGSFYIGFDIHLWSKIDRLESLVGFMRDALKNGNRNKWDVSSHKIVLGGMSGTATTGAGRIGPTSKPRAACEETTAAADASSSSAEDVEPIVIDEVVSFTGANHIVAVAFCGSETEACTSLKVLSDHDLVKEAIPIYDCTLGTAATAEQLHGCERKIIAELKDRIKRFGKLSMLVLDSGASRELHQIANSIFETYGHREKLLEKHSIAVTTWLSPVSSDEPWRLEFLDRYRKQIHHDPVKMGEFELVHSSSSTMTYGFGVVSTNDPDMNEGFDALEKKVTSRLEGTSTTVELRNLRGGLYRYVETSDHNPELFSQADYDQTLAQNHFDAQNPLAVQSVTQYDAAKEGFLTADVVEKSVFEAANEHDDDTLHKYLVGDGGVFLVAGETCNVIAVWDGKQRVSVNFFGVSDEAISEALDFSLRFRHLSEMEMLSADVQPRGVGRVVNLPEDLVPIDKKAIAFGVLQKQKLKEERLQRLLEDEDEEEDQDDGLVDAVEVDEAVEDEESETSSEHQTGEEL